MIETLENGDVVITGNGIKVFQATALANALKLYAKTKMQMTRGVTPGRMMKMAGEITGKTFRARDYMGAAVALAEWADDNRNR